MTTIRGIRWLMMLLALTTATAAAAGSCDSRPNNTHRKLLDCVTLDGVRQHQAALQAAADANGGTRTSGTPGYDASVDYVVAKLAEAGYDVTVQPFQYSAFIPLGPSTLEQVAPVSTAYVEETDYTLMAHTDAGDVTAPVVAVDLFSGTPSTSGCEPADFAGFPAGSIALIQRGSCLFQLKAENAAAAGAVGVIIFNEGNTPTRLGLVNGTLGSTYAGGIPVVFATYDRGVEWATTSGLVMHLVVDVSRGPTTTYNVLAETTTGRPDNVVMAGAHLDSIARGPGIQDNGSGSAALLEVALQMRNVSVVNKVRFAWWGAAEDGLIGSNEYLDGLSSSELSDIALYMDFDMIGSPNFVRFVYDGDGSGSGVAGAPGSGAIEALFRQFYFTRGLPSEPRSLGLSRGDLIPFHGAGIPVGGITTGAEEVKTPEQAAIYGGTAGDQYDPCYHLACDTYDNISLVALDQNADAVAYAVLQYAMNTESVNGESGRGSFARAPTGSGEPAPIDSGPSVDR